MLQDFGPIENDYAFFMSHSNEAENDLAAYLRELAKFSAKQATIRMLDFGCGTGEFTERLLSSVNWPPQLLELTLVEPVRHQREQAALRLARFSSTAITHSDRLVDIEETSFDLIVSNHVLYYVDDLPSTLQRITNSLAPNGLMLLALAAWDSVLLQLWKVGFAKLNRPVPYHGAEDVEAGLSRLGTAYEKLKVSYELCVPDSKENRGKILRFLFSHVLQEIGVDALLPEFDRYVVGDHIKIEAETTHFVVRGG